MKPPRERSTTLPSTLPDQSELNLLMVACCGGSPACVALLLATRAFDSSEPEFRRAYAMARSSRAYAMARSRSDHAEIVALLDAETVRSAPAKVPQVSLYARFMRAGSSMSEHRVMSGRESASSETISTDSPPGSPGAGAS